MSSLQTDIISRLRPRTVGEIVDVAFRLYRRNFRTFLLIVAVVYLPVRLLSYGADVFLLGAYTPPSFSTSLSGSLLASSVVSQVDMLKTYLETFLDYFAQWALTLAVAAAILDRPISFGEAYGGVRRRLGDVLGLIGLQALIAIGFNLPTLLIVMAAFSGGSGASSSLVALSGCLSIFSLIYGIISIRLQVILPAAVNEDLSPRQALSRSWELTHNYWWRTFALTLVLGIIGAIVSLGPGAVFVAIAGIAFKVDVQTSLAITQVVGIFTTILYVPVQIGAIALYYFDQRVRKEGFDLDLAISQRYENDEGRWPLYEQSPGNNKVYRVPAPARSMPPSPGVAIDASNNYGLGQDGDSYPLPVARQSGDAMSAIRQRAARAAEVKHHARLVSIHTIKKRKRDTQPSLGPGREVEQ